MPVPSYRRRLLVLLVLLLGYAGQTALAVQRIDARGLFKDRAILEIDGIRRLLRSGQTSPEGVTLISATSDRAVIEFDGTRRTLELGGRIGGTFAAPRSKSLRIVRTGNGMYLTTGSINGFPVQFLIDTGATLISMNSLEARRLGIDYRVIGEEGRSRTASGISRIWVVKLARVKVGEIELTNVTGAVHDGAFPQVTLLGMSFLSQLEMTRSGGALVLEQKY
jgi:aspartyl protease family protein